MTVDGIMDVIQGAAPFHHVTVTGGEPLMQRNTPELLKRLIGLGYDVQLETNGSLSLVDVPPAVRKIVDVKTPSSGHEGSFVTENLTCMTGRDELKFVISHRADFFFAVDFLERHGGGFTGQANCSPVFGVMDPAELAALMLSSGMRARLNLQLHRYIWGPDEEGKIVLFK
jgi:7-carboxy-7-deazaguanine synthase